MKSLAHPGWPYAGTAWEWRGFGMKVGEYNADYSPLTAGQLSQSDPELVELYENSSAVYQKQNFGPKLD
jgi:hypothetical protein